MLGLFTILLGLSAALLSAKCGTPQPSENIKALHLAAQVHEAYVTNGLAPRQSQENVIQTYVYVIEAGSSAADGNVSNSVIHKQIGVLNNAFAPAGFSFNLVSINNVLNQKWREIKYGSQLKYEMKSSIRHGHYRDVNLYIDTIAPVEGFNVLGYA